METVSELLSNWATEKNNTSENMILPENINIGENMQEFMNELQNHGKSLLNMLDELALDANAYDLLQKYVREIGRQSCQVAVIGQMKAGKSSFINALIGYEDLLPSDVNPWTTVVTKLHFGGINLPDEGAEFSFFDENQWERLAEGDTKLRNLVERFLPGFETDRLSQQLEEMRHQAQRRLGTQFNELLGHSHWFDRISPDILKRYVCAGPTWNDEEETDVGRFSDITETADIYFKSFPFVYPTTITDTPGTNDPFFVRDEITFRNLDSSDIFIVVLTAQQAFSMSDLALLRILQGLHKDRIIIYINRIDQLDDWKRESKEIIAHVQYMLQREFPSVKFPIIAGSALWGKMALKKETGENTSAESASLSAYYSPSDASKADTEDILTKEQARSELYACSGIPEVASTISKLMLMKGKSRGSVGKIASTLKLTADSLLAVMNNKVLSIQSEIKRANITTNNLSTSETEALSQKLRQLRDLTSKCNNIQMQYEKKLEHLQESILDCFRTKLNDIVEEFAQTECQDLVKSMETGKRNKVWRCNTTKIRQNLEDEFLVICREAAVYINNMQKTAINEIKYVFQAVAPNADNDFLNYKEIAEGEPYLSTLALKHTLALDLDKSWWKLWAQKYTPEHWSNELNKLIRSEFFPMVERLVQSAKAELTQRIDDSTRNFATMNQSIINIIHDHISKIQNQAPGLIFEEGQNGSSTNTTQHPELEQHLVAFQKRIAHIDNISQQLKQIIIRYNLFLEKEGHILQPQNPAE